MKKLTNQILIISILFLILTLGISYFLYSLNEQRHINCTTEIPQNFCGTIYPEINQSMKGVEGRKLFNTNCAACHKLNKIMTGPSLRGIFNNGNYPYKNYAIDFITKEDSLIKINDKYTKAINEEYSADFTHSFKFTESEIEQLMEFLKK